ncbi:sushi domain-containing protein 5 [Acanthochromis polyacanthus]|uniref:sushi domain-containing protein 5 n=1 Tax=Acanthochromis polyacanthus TaxID=80966 RepID=UPI0022345E14|nr:sushi domain-containing protein 5 [Acanthochromis polyacanthus]
MLDRCNQNLQALLFGCLVCLVVTSVVNADGRVFVLDLRNSTGLQGFRDAERACASQHARLASAEELRHAVVGCYFSPCTRGWLHGGTVGSTVCNIVGSALKAVDVRTENATDDTTHLDAFCIKDKDVPCGDPPSFPNARLQGHSGFEMGDELLYACVPGYVMPSGQTAFSLLCDSCGEWYGLVQICVKDETESHVDYEDKFTDSYGETEHHNERPEEAHGETYEESHGAAYPDGKTSHEQQETSFSVKVEEEHQDQHEVGGKVINHGGKFEEAVEKGEKAEERAVEDFTGHPVFEQERTEVVQTDAAAATEAPVSLLSQKHLFWFPSEAFQEEEPPVSNNPVTQTTQRASGAQSEESKEHESQERPHHQRPVDADDHHRDSYDDDDKDDHDHSRHDDQDIHEDSHYDDHYDSHQDEDHEDSVKLPAQHDDLDSREHHNDHDDHYDMGEHEEERDRVRYGSQKHNDRDNTYDDHDDHGDDDGEHPDGSEEHPDDDHDDHDDHEDHDDQEEEEHDDGEEHYDHYSDHDDHDDHDHKDDSYDDHDSHEDDDDHHHLIVSMATDERQNTSQRGVKATTDETWLDGYPVVPEETENGDSTTEKVRPDSKERGSVTKTTDRPNEVEIRLPVSYTSLPEENESPTTVPELDHRVVEEVWPSFIRTPAPSADHLDPSDSPSYSDTLDYDTQQAAPTHSWMDDLTEHPFLDQGLPPPMHDNDDDVFTGSMEERNLPSETGERGEVEREMGEMICVGENCPPRPPSSSGRGPTVAAIIVAVCAVATAVIVGVWCYRRQQQKSSVYEMNGKGQSQSRQGQQIEMQQKV